ncbi:histidine phosphatase family protein [Sphingobium boeckii]|uniref:Broad specificity phosphatase PhoE n=1 Tax=Sphingobium boeckii TaxID=1082345 RepID=A0A7W9ECM2_9SPHN|nr:histidine phosphatase family protein [Sphingobium boeckii]MBB5684423.1 broad specificity phosphatase PhoE [Sphingobium boeckii]
MAARWPSTLWLVRHGESAGNVAARLAVESGLDRIPLAGRDVDIPLSPRGAQQADALGRWFAQGKAGALPAIILSSPYLRAHDTAKRLRDAGGGDTDEVIILDERLREKEMGILDGLTPEGVAAINPEQAQFRHILGKFYHRAPGGESWCDVILRLRAMMDTISLHYSGQRVMIVAHQVIVLCLRYILEELDEAQILAIDADGDVANCSITEYRFDAHAGKRGCLKLVRYNVTEALEESRADVTTAPDPIVAARG